MRPALWCLGLFVFGFVIHIVLWRVRRPAAHRKALLGLFSALLVLFLALNALFSLLPAWEWVHVTICYVPLYLAYIALYSGIEHDSPSLTMVKFVAASGDRGRRREDFEGVISDADFVEIRLAAMVDEDMAVRHGDRLGMTPKGLAMARLFSFAARIFNHNLGG